MIPTSVLMDSIPALLAADTANLAAATAMHIHLMIEAFTPAADTDFTALTEADFNGSTAKNAGTGAQQVYYDPVNGEWVVQLLEPAGGWHWETVAAGGWLDQTVYGWIGTDTAKDEIFSFLRVTEPGSPGFSHFPAHYADGYFKQLCAEKKVTKYVQGVARQVWKKVSEGARNEALDVRVYATAARSIVNPNIRKMASNYAEKSEKPQELDADQPMERQKPSEIPAKRRRFRVKNNPFSGYKV